MAVQPFANIFFSFPLLGLDHYCTEHNGVGPQTTIINLSIMSVHSPPHSPLSLKVCPSFVPLSPYSVALRIMKMERLK